MGLKRLINKTEILELIKEYELFDIRSTVGIERLVSLLENGLEPEDEDSLYCPLFEWKIEMETYIQKNIKKMRTQLPGCTGTCTEFGCPRGVVTNCYIKMKPLLEKSKT